MRLPLVAAAALVLVGSSGAMGQVDAATLIGQRVRLRSAGVPHDYVVGSLIRVDADSAELADASGSRQRWALSHFDQAQRSLGRRNHKKGGLLIGATTGVLLGVLAGFGSDDDLDCTFCIYDTAGMKAARFGLLLGLLGAVVGAVAGTLVSTDVWEDVSHVLLPQAAGRTSEPHAVP